MADLLVWEASWDYSLCGGCDFLCRAQTLQNEWNLLGRSRKSQGLRGLRVQMIGMAGQGTQRSSYGGLGGNEAQEMRKESRRKGLKR